ncbi:hypothetical protein JCM21714_4019 [Gracilibacillus boraciitolerans JCM 21714]|uniref:Zinc finger CGNR domain-containing protein n=1 Tax=Gracilibacillus boraciitolerans JCM 21714 TaxID=1298598 RepID=W4VN29_9BACI|nr:CGNR zinc finger domain-containing protein [Gracilibacillus boraciitolerans]GAE94825.1 hypothetical protein JCM21714_4019 [Gracilibacillus boraciitolerans JCM 21714]
MINDFTNVGNHPALNFLNTRLIKKDQRIELLESFTDIECWLDAFGVLPYMEDLTNLSDQDKSILVTEVLDVRSKLEEMVDHLMVGQLPNHLWVEYMNDKLRQNAGYDRLIINENKVSIVRSYSARNLVGYFADQTLRLLNDVEHSRIKKCSSTNCIMYFYDSSRNMSRRWCDVSQCGNRANASKHYHRNKGTNT